MTDSALSADGVGKSRRAVPLPLFVLVTALLLIAGGVAVYFAAQYQRTTADVQVLADGIDRSRLPMPQAVALAKLSESRGQPLPEHMSAHGDHGDDMHMEMTPEEMAARQEQIAAARSIVPLLDTVEEAEAAGYFQASSESDGAGAHWVNWDLVDKPFDPARPAMLLFDELYWGEGLELIALSYYVSSPEEPEGFVGHDDNWHQHFGLCVVNGWVRDERIPRETCAGDWLNGSDLWMLHTWVVPEVENELGLFAVVNPKLCERICGAEN